MMVCVKALRVLCGYAQRKAYLSSMFCTYYVAQRSSVIPFGVAIVTGAFHLNFVEKSEIIQQG